MALGIASAGGSFGQMSIIPMAQGLMEFGGFEFSLLCLAVLAFIVVPLAVPMAVKPTEETALATVGFFNMIGTYAHGALGGCYRMKNLLAINYVLRGVFIMA